MPYDFTELGNADRFIRDQAKDVRYCSKMKTWFYWDGMRWVEDPNETEIVNKAISTVLAIPQEVQTNPAQKKEILVHAQRSQNYSRIQATVKLARSYKNIQIDPDRFDADPWLINCPNGVLDLRRGVLMPHDRNYFMTLCTGVEYQKEAEAPQFLKFLKEIMNGSEEMVSFLQRIFGYALTGTGVEQCLFFLVGSGSNGKTTLIETLRKVYGTYARHTPTATLIRNGMAIRNDLARLRGARFVTASEISRGKELDEATTKVLTGEDPVTSRFLFREFFEYRPTFKLFFIANHTPEIKGTDFGIWRRILLVPFVVTISGDKVDKSLPMKLADELEGIFSWLVQGCLQWQRESLKVPLEVRVATQEYRSQTDILPQFLKDCCLVDITKKVPSRELYEAYRGWAANNADEVLTQKAFGSYLKTAGYKPAKSNGVRYWKGLELKKGENNDSSAENPKEAISEPNSLFPMTE